MKEFEDKMEDIEKEKIESGLKELKEATESEDLERMKTLSEEINTAWHTISERIYKAGAAENAADDIPEEDAGTEDVNYEEVE